MKNLLIALLTTTSFFVTASGMAQKPSIDVAKSTVNWKGYAEAGNYAPSGSVKIKSGTVGLSNETLKSARIEIDMNTLTHENKDLEKHLKDSDFFDCEKYPVATFVLLKVSKITAKGLLTIKNITKPISFPIAMSKQDGALVIKANLKIDRTLYNIKYNSSSFFQDLGNYAIKNEFDLAITIVINK